MAFESLSDRLQKTFKNITGKGKLTEKNMNDMLKYVCLYWKRMSTMVSLKILLPV